MKILISKTGKESFKRKIQTLNLAKIDVSLAKAALTVYEQYTVEQIHIVSVGVEIFYNWVCLSGFLPTKQAAVIMCVPLCSGFLRRRLAIACNNFPSHFAGCGYNFGGQEQARASREQVE